MPRKKTTEVQDIPADTAPPSDVNGHAETPVEAAPTTNGNGKKLPAFKVGPIPTGKGESVGGCVWENSHTLSDGREYTVHSIVLDISYYHEVDKVWKKSNGIRPSQLATVEHVLRKCADFCFARRDLGNDCPL